MCWWSLILPDSPQCLNSWVVFKVKNIFQSFWCWWVSSDVLRGVVHPSFPHSLILIAPAPLEMLLHWFLCFSFFLLELTGFPEPVSCSVKHLVLSICSLYFHPYKVLLKKNRWNLGTNFVFYGCGIPSIGITPNVQFGVIFERTSLGTFCAMNQIKGVKF